MSDMRWQFEQEGINWNELSELYRIAPLGSKSAEGLKLAFTNSMFKCFVFDGDTLVGVGRAVADGIDCSYLCDVAIHPEHQGRGLGKEGFYKKLGFLPMRTAMAIFENQEKAIQNGLVEAP